ncbi:MAG TPA: hypothetical protein VHP83_08300 [Aggregatilineaceae bacterium]|nr:hypothetical protein [Aggregatilineaceae bacterium]
MTWIKQNRTKATLITLILGLTGIMAVGVWVVLRGDDSPAAVEATMTPPIPRDLAPDAVVETPFVSLSYGIHAFLWWNEATRPFDLDMVRLMQFDYVKQRFAWADIEPLRDEWHWDQADAVVDEAECRGPQVVARLDGPPDWAILPASEDVTEPPIDLDAWGDYCGAVAERYQGRIAAYQVWNEPNLDREWANRPPNAAGYVQLLSVCSTAIRAADPDAIIISAGLAPTGTQLPDAIPDMDYLRQMYDAGAAPWFDVLGLNAPGYKAPPEMSPDEAEKEYGNRWMSFRHVEDMRGIMVEKGDAAKQVALLEVGWTIDPRQDTSYAWHAVSEEDQAKYLTGAYQYAAEHWRPWVGLMVTIYLADIQWTEANEEYWWAVNRAGYPYNNDDPWESRLSYIGLSTMAKYKGDAYIPPRDPHSEEATMVEPALECD